MDKDGKRAWKQRLELKKHSKTLKKHARRVEGVTSRHAHRFVVNRWDKIREIRLHIIFWLGGVGILIALVGLQMTWFQRSYVTSAAVSGGTYAEAMRGPIQTLNPLFATTPAELASSHLLFSSLFSTDSSGHIHGDIATSMKSENDKTFTVKLRRDARWHDGKPLTADDVTYTVGLMKSQAVRSVMTASWQGVNVQQLDDYTLKFMLPASYAAFPQALTFSILPQHLLRTVDPTSLRESAYSSAPIGSGPFTLRLMQIVNLSKGHKILHLDANRNFYGGSPRLDRFQLHAYGDDINVVRALRTGEVNAASDVEGESIGSINTNDFITDIKPVNNGVYALFNMGQPVVKDKKVRQALQIATNTAEIRKQFYGNPQQLYLPFVNGQVEGLNAIAPPQLNTKEAERLLDEAGYVKQGKTRAKGNEKLQLRVVTRKNNDYESALETLAGQWRKLGIQVDTHVIEPGDFTQEVLQIKNFDVLLDQLVIGGDPDVFAYWHSRGQLNLTNYGDQTSDDALSSARTTSDPKLRAVKYVAFARQWLYDVPAIGLYQSNMIYLHTKSTRSLEPNEKIVNPDEHYANVRYWTAEQSNLYKTP